MSPFFTVILLPSFPGPTATTSPLCGFSLAVSGMMMPPVVFSSAGAGFHDYSVINWFHIISEF
jgi:hypothetical protein